MLTEAVVACIRGGLLWVGKVWNCGTFDTSTAYAWKVAVAISIGFVFAAFSNTNRFHKLLPDWITKRTSFPSEWFSAFSSTKLYVYLDFADGRRLFGWPEEWPDEPGKGHFVITNPEWILDDNSRVPLKAIERILIPAALVEFVEFQKPSEELIGLTDQIKEDSSLMREYNSTSGKTPQEKEVHDE